MNGEVVDDKPAHAQARTVIRHAAILLASFGVTACALPGYDSSFSDEQSWYSFGGESEATYNEQVAANSDIDYDPTIIPITPSLLRHQAQERAEQTLAPNQQSITAGGDVDYQRTTAYKIGRGDVLEVIVFGHPELGGPGGGGAGMGTGLTQGGTGSSLGVMQNASGQLVDSDGEIYFPYVGTVKAAGMTTKDLRRKIANDLGKYIRSPQVDVRVRQYRSQEVYVSGDIAKPCTVPITDVTLTVLQALDRCDTLQASVRTGVNADAGGVGVQNVTLIRDGNATPLDLNQVYATGRPVPLQPNDRLLVDDSPNRVFMVGEFREQTALPYSTGGMALSDAIADAGGVSLETANTEEIYVVRGFVSDEQAADGGIQTTMRPRVYKLNASSAGGLLLANQFQLQPRDVVFAPPASLVNFNRALAQLTPSLDILFRSFLIYDRSSNRNN